MLITAFSFQTDMDPNVLHTAACRRRLIIGMAVLVHLKDGNGSVLVDPAPGTLGPTCMSIQRGVVDDDTWSVATVHVALNEEAQGRRQGGGGR